ncbi:hypothetical protein lbkm_3657 [Lachnospiraceae bacterium KM106-2]|nr:hypothetical protein lbkm_3657 [Lachnospiraceae bacterium KM106-2]
MRMLKFVQKGKMRESLLTAMLLALVGGFLDIYTYLARGRVFANTQTGNLVLLGYNLAKGNANKVIYYLLPLFFFSVGVVLTKVVEHRFHESKVFNWIHASIGIELGVLLIVAFIPAGPYNVVANILVSFACGLQAQTFRKVNGNAYSTTMFTGNLKNAAERLTHYFLNHDEEALENGLVYCAVIIMFILGATLGDWIISILGERAVLFACQILVIVFYILYFERGEKRMKTP